MAVLSLVQNFCTKDMVIAIHRDNRLVQNYCKKVWNTYLPGMAKRGPQPEFTANLHLVVRPDTLERLKELAQSRELPVSVVVRQAIEEWLEKAVRE